MRRSTAWIIQARSDLMLAQRLYAIRQSSASIAPGTDDCQIASKCQQAIEKAMKAIVDKLHDAQLSTTPLDGKHPVARYASLFTRLAAGSPRTSVVGRLGAIFTPARTTVVGQLDATVPVYPAAGALARRNGEYPFQDATGDWRPPARRSRFHRG